jgi:predicted O-linked N-acetylglucosamine transferase (SPINDLY family)
VGLVSPDFRSHPVGHFLESVLAALSQKHGDQLELHAYFCDKREDEVTQRLKPLFAHWHAAAAWSPARLAEQVHGDAIDILIDLAGYTENHRLLTFAAKPAPVQASWLGYFATTGLRQIDHLIGDGLTLLPGEEASYTEHVWRLPHTRLCFTPPRAEVDVKPLPALANGHITFGCFNTLNKVNDVVVETWSRILRALPGSRLVIKNREVEQAANAAALTARFARHGVDASQLQFQHSSAREAYLDSYNGIDIALDPFPYTGGTTTAESLWMGVPVLTLAGQTMLSRQGLGLLTNAGLPDWVAHNAEEYVAKAVAFASDRDALARLRQGLRAQVLASPVFDADRFADDLHQALRGMWQRWCDAQQASAPAVS